MAILPNIKKTLSMAGFKSLSDIKADGMEFDTFLTKDKKLVVFHYDNTLVL